MARFLGSVSNQDPLQMQLKASAQPCVVTGFMACGNNQLGSATRPFLTRPSVEGTGSGNTIALSESGATSSNELVTSFLASPSLAPAGPFTGYYNHLPIKVRWTSSFRNGFVVALLGSIVLYAGSAGGHTWSGELIWEEK